MLSLLYPKFFFLRSIGVFLLANLFLGPIALFLPIYAKEIYGDSMDGFAGLESAIGIGTVFGGLILTFIKLPWNARVNIFFAMLFCALSSFTMSYHLVVGCFSVGLLGLFLSVGNVVILEFFQTTTKEPDILKIMSLVNLITVSAYPISMLMTSLITQVLYIKSYAIICALIVLVTSIGIVFIPNLTKGEGSPILTVR